MDRWPTHQPDRRWQIFDPQELSVILLARADIADLDEIEERIAPLRDELVTLKEQAISLLTVASGRTSDPFLARKLQEAEAIVYADPATIAADLARDGPDWSRDSRAISQGRRIAPHQRLKAVCLSATATENGLSRLDRILREAASHMVQLGGVGNQTNNTASNMVFIGHGHSALWREFKDFIKDRVGLPYEEFNRIPVAGITSIVRLTQMLEAAAIAFLIFTAEDEHADGNLHARENVIHEAGLFQGRLGFEKAIVLLEEGCTEFSNLAGLGQIRFPKGNISAAYEEVRRVLEREGLLPAG